MRPPHLASRATFNRSHVEQELCMLRYAIICLVIVLVATPGGCGVCPALPWRPPGFCFLCSWCCSWSPCFVGGGEQGRGCSTAVSRSSPGLPADTILARDCRRCRALLRVLSAGRAHFVVVCARRCSSATVRRARPAWLWDLSARPACSAHSTGRRAGRRSRVCRARPCSPARWWGSRHKRLALRPACDLRPRAVPTGPECRWT